ncbi:hypothetical protein HMPREF3212_02874 [Citrobacter freundii]|nr:hypothetical protein HMPREF3212_02874 [Citrobacter freundii]
MIVYTIAQSGWRLNVGFFAGCGVALSGLQNPGLSRRPDKRKRHPASSRGQNDK